MLFPALQNGPPALRAGVSVSIMTGFPPSWPILAAPRRFCRRSSRLTAGNGRRAGKKLPAGERASALAVHITAAPIADHGDARRDIVRERAADRGLDAISPVAAELSRPISVQILARIAGDDVDHARDRKSTRLNSSH